MRFHPVRGVVIVAAAVAILATYQVWIWIAGVGGVKGWNLGLWTYGNSWLTEVGIQDGYATLAIAASTMPLALLGKLRNRLHWGSRIYVLLAGLALATFVALEVVRMLRTRAAAHVAWQAEGTTVGFGLEALAVAALALIAAGLFPSMPRSRPPYVEPEYRL
jgi:hypothetical protein